MTKGESAAGWMDDSRLGGGGGGGGRVRGSGRARFRRVEPPPLGVPLHARQHEEIKVRVQVIGPQ